MSTLTAARSAAPGKDTTSAGGFDLPPSQKALIRWNLYLGFSALAFGVVHGLAQALSYGGIDILGWFPGLKNYYQGLTIHGVFNAIVLTFAFANGFLALTTARGLGRKLHDGLLHAAFWTLAAGIALASYAMFTGKASVLYTFYAPLQAHWSYYLGLALLVVSTWITSVNLFITLKAWRKEHPGERIPLLAFVSVATYIMWDIASLGIAAEVVGLLLPWSLGLVSGSDPLLSRTLFWFSGHPIVYFWLLPAYVSWYLMIPKQVGGRLFSDPVTRVVFSLFVLLSIPVGFHHQYTDPGITQSMKVIHAILTFGVFFPSLITAFSVVSALEDGGKARGGRGLVGWFFKLPWGDPSVAAQVLAMLTFVLGGITGLINASFTVNRVVHNTSWVPGHFHMTVGSAVVMTFMGIAYWMVPWLKGRKLWGGKLAVVQSWVYFIGVMALARGLISAGLEGAPRRTFLAGATYGKDTWQLAGYWSAAGGTLMFIGAMLFFLILLMTVLTGKKGEVAEIPVTTTIQPAARAGWELRLDQFRWVVILALILIAIAYVPFLVEYLPAKLTVPAFKIF